MGNVVKEIESSPVCKEAVLAGRPMKRRRSRKACDSCRKRKVKCDADLPCLACAEFGEDCTYTEGKARKKTATQYVNELEKCITHLKSILVKIFPNYDVDDPLFESNVNAQIGLIQDILHSENKKGRVNLKMNADDGIPNPKKDDLLDTMIEVKGHLNIDGRGNCIFQSDFAGLSFLRRIEECCTKLLDTDSLKKKISGQLPLPQNGVSARSVLYPNPAEPVVRCMLPSEATAIQLTRTALEDAFCLMKFIHRPSFDRLLNRIYHLEPENYTSEEESFLPLLYMTLAIGELCSRTLESQKIQPGQGDKVHGAKYFRAAEGLLDIMDCNNMHSLQTLVCMIFYLQGAALMHSCYTYMTVAIAAAFRMGLHRSTASNLLDPVLQETRRRVFSVLRTMETYLTMLFGTPLIINDDDIDQLPPLGIEDSCIPANGIVSARVSSIPAMAVTNAHTNLLLIMRKIIRDIYPHGKNLDGQKRSYRVDYARVIEVEADLDGWFRTIPQPPSNQPVSCKELRIQFLLRCAYAYVQMILYRPFLHHIVRQEADGPLEMRSYACASACIKAAMQLIWLVEEMDLQAVCTSADWFLSYMTFFSVMSLCMFFLGNNNDPTVSDAIAAAEKGRKLLDKIASENHFALCSASVDDLLDRMSIRFRKGNGTVATPRVQVVQSDCHQVVPNTSENGPFVVTEVKANMSVFNKFSSQDYLSLTPGFNPTLNSLSDISEQYNELAANELLAMIYPMADNFPFELGLNVAPVPDSNVIF